MASGFWIAVGLFALGAFLDHGLCVIAQAIGGRKYHA